MRAKRIQSAKGRLMDFLVRYANKKKKQFHARIMRRTIGFSNNIRFSRLFLVSH